MANRESITRPDVYQTVTDRILSSLERGVAPWIKPWDASGEGVSLRGVEHHNVASGKAYRGINTILLWIAGAAFSSPVWGTFKQWQERGGTVRKGEKGTRIVFFKELLVTDRIDPDAKAKVLMLREYCVFNRDQVAGLRAEPGKPVKSRAPLAGMSEAIDEWFGRVGADVRIGGTRACYVPSQDFIAMPASERFRSPDDYYSTLAHEHAHWTGHATRNARDLTGWRASPAYAYEELIAEISSAFTCARLGVRLDRLQHAEYVASWCQGMRDHRQMIVSAASAAQRATDYLFGLAGDCDADLTGEDHGEPEAFTVEPLDLGKPSMRMAAGAVSIGLGGLGFTYGGELNSIEGGSALGIPLFEPVPTEPETLFDIVARVNVTHTAVYSFGRSDDGAHDAIEGLSVDLPEGRARTYRYIMATRGKRAANAYASRYRARQREIEDSQRETGRYYVVSDAQLARDLRGRTHTDVRREVAASISQRLSGRYQLGNQHEEYVQAMIDAGRVPSLAGAGTVARENITIGLRHERERMKLAA